MTNSSYPGRVSPSFPIRASVEVLRAEARDELHAVIMERCRNGEDPWDFMEELPTADEIVVLTIRAETGGRAFSPVEDAPVLRAIAQQHPELSSAVWRLLGRAA